MLNELLFTKIEEEDIGNIRFQQDGTTQPKLHPMFCALFLKIVLSTAELMSELRFDTVGLLFMGRIKGKCYADKPETIDALNDNIREAIGEIQLHTIDNWTAGIGYCMASFASHLNEIIFHY